MIGSSYWPQTRIRRQGRAAHRNLRMRAILKGSSVYLVFFFVFAIGYVWLRVQVMEKGYRIRQLEVEQEKLKETNKTLAVEAATLKSPQRLEALAAQAGFHRPAQDQVYFLKK